MKQEKIVTTSSVLRSIDEVLESMRDGERGGDVQDVLKKPFLADFKPARTRSQLVANERPNRGYFDRIWRGQSAPPSLDERVMENLSPPRKRETNPSILFRAVSAMAVYFAVGILASVIAEDELAGIKSQSLIDALYFSVVTLTTVGYGDLVPGSTAGKLFTCAYVFVGFGLVGALVGGAANYIVERQEEILVHTIKRKERKVDFEQAALDDLQTANWKALVSGMLVLGLFVVGIIFLILYEKMGFVDAFYCVCVTVTTLGYGDHTFLTATGRLFAAAWILSSTVCVAQLFLYVAEMRTQQRQLELAHWVLHRRTTRTDLEAADLDEDGAVSASEFVIFKLKELGKIDEEDVVGILREFRKLDYDKSGTISIRDLNLAQPS